MICIAPTRNARNNRSEDEAAEKRKIRKGARATIPGSTAQTASLALAEQAVVH